VIARRLAVCGLLGVALAAAGCIQISRYPRSWPPLETVDGNTCAVIAGTFAGTAQTEPPSEPRMSPNLGSVFDIYGATAVMIVQPGDDAIEVTVLSQFGRDLHAGTRRTLSRAAGDFECAADGIALRPWKGVDRYYGAVVWGRNRVTLRKSADGALIVRQAPSGIGLVMMVPFVFVGRAWYRYTPFVLDSPR